MNFTSTLSSEVERLSLALLTPFASTLSVPNFGESSGSAVSSKSVLSGRDRRPYRLVPFTYLGFTSSGTARSTGNDALERQIIKVCQKQTKWRNNSDNSNSRWSHMNLFHKMRNMFERKWKPKWNISKPRFNAWTSVFHHSFQVFHF